MRIINDFKEIRKFRVMNHRNEDLTPEGYVIYDMDNEEKLLIPMEFVKFGKEVPTTLTLFNEEYRVIENQLVLHRYNKLYSQYLANLNTIDLGTLLQQYKEKKK